MACEDNLLDVIYLDDLAAARSPMPDGAIKDHPLLLVPST
jgi:hypothetical protein